MRYRHVGIPSMGCRPRESVSDVYLDLDALPAEIVLPARDTDDLKGNELAHQIERCE